MKKTAWKSKEIFKWAFLTVYSVGVFESIFGLTLRKRWGLISEFSLWLFVGVVIFIISVGFNKYAHVSYRIENDDTLYFEIDTHIWLQVIAVIIGGLTGLLGNWLRV